MKLKSSIILLSIAVIAASCSKNHYAQVEPDDLYFTHKDRKAAIGETIITPAPSITSVEPVETPTEYEQNDYSAQHSPVFSTPSFGSPTIQQYGQKPYYDTSVNPDYLYEEEYSEAEGSNEYYNEDYVYQAPPAYETPQINNYYYGLPQNNYYPSSAWVASSYYGSYNPFRYPSSYWSDPYYGYVGYPYYGWGVSSIYNNYNWCNPFNPYTGSYVAYNNNYYGGGSSYGYYNNNYYDGGTKYADGTKVVTKPRRSRNQVSSEVDKTNLPIKSRRADYIPVTGESGRIATNNTAGRTSGTVTNTSNTYTRRGNSTTIYTPNESTKNGRYSKNSTAYTVQDRNRNAQSDQKRNRTVVIPTRTRTNYANNSGQRKQKDNTTYNANRSSVNRSNAGTRSGSTTRYSTRTTNANRSSYNRSNSGTRSNTSYSTRSRSSSNRSSGTRSSYSSGRSSSRSYSAPSRSSGSSGRSYSPSRSSSSRSSGTRSSSSGRSSSGRSSSKKN